MGVGIHLADAVVRIVTDPTDFQKSLEDIRGSLNELEQQAQAAIVPLAAMTAVGTGLIAKTTMTAARTEELGVVIENLGRVAGYSQQELVDTEESIKKLGITTQASREMMARLMGAEMDLADATKIARAAQDLAVIGMKDSSEAAQDLTYAIVSMMPQLLRKYGIYVNLNQVYEEAAAALGKEATALTESEKRLAYKNTVLEAAANYTGTYESAMTTAGKQIRSFSRYIQEASNAIGDYFLPYLTEAVEVATEFMKSFLGAGEETHTATSRIVLYGTAIVGANTAMAALVLLAPKVGAAITFMTGPFGILATTLGVLTIKYLEYRQEMREFKAETMETAKSAQEYAEVLLAEERAIIKARMAMGDEIAVLELQGLKQKEAALQLEYYEQILGDVVNEQTNLSYEMEAYGGIVENEALPSVMAHIKATKEQAKASMTLREVLGELGGAWYGHINDIRDAMAAYHELENKIISVGADTSETTWRYQRDTVRAEEDALEKRAELLQKHAEKRAWIESGDWARSKEERDEAHDYWEGIMAQELADFDADVAKKAARREEDYQHSISVANAAAAERRRIAEEERQAELAEMRAAQEERILIAALEMLEVKELLKLPWVEASVTAEEYYEAVKTGLVPVSGAIRTELGGALGVLRASMREATSEGTTGFDNLRETLNSVIPDVMDVGKETEEAIKDSSKPLEGLREKFGRFGRESKEQTEELADTLDREVRKQLKESRYDTEDLEREFRIAAQEGVEASSRIEGSMGYLRSAIVDVEDTENALKNSWVENCGKIVESLEDVRQKIEDIHDEIDDLPTLKEIIIRIKYEKINPPEGFQYGFHGLINKPTLFWAGERGPEWVDVTPTNRAITPTTVTRDGRPVIIIEGPLIVDPQALASEDFVDMLEELR